MRNFNSWIDESNSIRIKLIARQNKEMVDWWVELLTKAKEAYYNGGKPIMDDATYDHFENNIRLNDPDHPFLKKVGSAPVHKPNKFDLL